MSQENYFVLLILTDDSRTVSSTFLIIAIQRAVSIWRYRHYRYKNPHVKDKSVSRPSYLYYENPHTWEWRSLYWDGCQMAYYLHGLAIQVIHVAMTVAICITTCLSRNGVQYNVSKFTHFGHHCPVKYLANTVIMIHQQLILIFIWMTETIIYQA